MDQHAYDVASAERIAIDGIRAFTAAALHHDVLHNAARGLRAVLKLSDHAGVVGISAEIVRDLSNASTDATPALATAVAETLTAECACLGMGAAAGLVALFGKTRDDVITATTLPLLMDRIDHAALLASRLDTIVLRQNIERRGDVLRRLITLARFSNQSSRDDLALH